MIQACLKASLSVQRGGAPALGLGLEDRLWTKVDWP
jgi:hypothetical protein